MATTYATFLNKMGGTNVSTFIGKTGTLFYDPSTQTLRMSDGTTPGGVAINSSAAGGQIEVGNTSVAITDTGTDGEIKLKTEGTARWAVTTPGHILPVANAAYDLGSAEFKVRHLFLSNNSLWIGDEHKIDVEGGKLKFRKRKKNKVPKVISEAGGDAEGAKTSSSKANIEDMTVDEWVTYARTLGGLGGADVSTIWKNNITHKEDYDEITEPGTQHGHVVVPPNDGVAVAEMDLVQSNVAILKNVPGPFSLNINGAVEDANAEGASFEATIHILQSGAVQTINTSGISINGTVLTTGAAGTLTEGNTPNFVANKLSTYKVYASFIGQWRATIVGYPQ